MALGDHTLSTTSNNEQHITPTNLYIVSTGGVILAVVVYRSLNHFGLGRSKHIVYTYRVYVYTICILLSKSKEFKPPMSELSPTGGVILAVVVHR